ncbi:MAG TPA: tripartite tricarboxylate transporter substrate binding protein [Burkholderiales bacterium]|nr:tripartite tricarboxylate transporter substrate binding protein [Burkholderiales bacterium]
MNFEPGSRLTRSCRYSLLACAFCCAVPVLLSPGIAAAQAYPAKPIRFVLAFGAPGGAPDTIARSIGPKLTDAWGHQVIVDPRTGAGGTIATEIVAKAPPDGYTMLLASPSHAINSALYSRLPYDPVADFAPVTLVADVPNIVVVHPSVPARSVRQLIALAKARPGALLYGSAGSGSSQHLAGELFQKMAGVRMVHVPYKGGGAVVIDLIAGQLQLTFGSTTSLPGIRSGRLVALAVTTAKRVGVLPDLPTVAEAGLPGYEAAAWYAVFAPARTPRSIIEKVQTEIARAMRLPDVRERLGPQLIEPVGSSPSELGAFLRQEIAKWGAIVRESGAKAD